jgi:hypothetical protein
VLKPIDGFQVIGKAFIRGLSQPRHPPDHRLQVPTVVVQSSAACGGRNDRGFTLQLAQSRHEAIGRMKALRWLRMHWLELYEEMGGVVIL